MSQELIVPTAGIHHGIAAEVYHSWNAVSHSWLNRLHQSPAHLADLIENGGIESTPDQVFGSAVHCIVLEPDEFPHRYAVRTEGVSGVTKAGKEFAAMAEGAGMTILSATDGRWVEAVARRARFNARLSEWLHRKHETEVSLVWERDGYLCKARADLMVSGLNIIADLKTTTTGSAAGFARQVARFNYHAQAAWYLDGIQRLTGQVWDWWFVVAEKRRPFLVNCQAVPRDSVAHRAGVEQNDELFALYKRCNETGKWPGYEDVDEIQLPDWSIGESIAEEAFGD